MRIGIGLLALSAAAACGDDGNMLPVGGGGGDGGFTFPDGNGGGGGDASSGSDAGSDGSVSAIDAAQLMGRVCLAVDPRKLNVCSDTQAGGLTVRIGTTSTTTAANGTFTINYSGGTQWRVTGTNIVSSFMLLGDYEIPALLKTTYDTMKTTNLGNLPPNPGEGAVMIQVIYDGAHVAGATGATTPTGAWLAFYDDAASQTDWARVATGADGAIWFPELDVGTVSVNVETPIGDKTVAGLPVNDGGITFASVILP